MEDIRRHIYCPLNLSSSFYIYRHSFPPSLIFPCFFFLFWGHDYLRPTVPLKTEIMRLFPWRLSIWPRKKWAYKIGAEWRFQFCMELTSRVELNSRFELSNWSSKLIFLEKNVIYIIIKIKLFNLICRLDELYRIYINNIRIQFIYLASQFKFDSNLINNEFEYERFTNNLL